MEYLARKVVAAKWDEPGYFCQPLDNPQIKADAVTGGCLRTHGDTLSLWECDHSNVKEVVLALATAKSEEAKLKEIRKMNLILFSRRELEENGYVLENTDGDTVITELVKRHFDLKNLTMIQVCDISRKIAVRIRAETHYYCYFKPIDIKNILTDAIKIGKLDPNKLTDKVRSKLI
jgi:hypothetical protein